MNGQLEVYIDDGEGTVRLLDRESKIVVKIFDTAQGELYSLKFWKGDIDRVVAHWNTKFVERQATQAEVSMFDKACIQCLRVLQIRIY
jgi:hypothetical protein